MRLMQRDEAALSASEEGPPRGLIEESPEQQRDLIESPPSVLGMSGAGVVERDGVIIVAPVGVLPDPLPALLAAQLETRVAERPVIVDLSGITLVSATPVVDLASWVLGVRQQPGQCCIVCARATARALLRRWHITRCLAVFSSVGDALQARRFAQAGYGTGWRPASPGSACPDPSIDHSRAVLEHPAPH
jgi:anti-anti-sigma regulatory factor